MIYDNEEVEPDDDIIDLIKEKDYWNDEDINLEFLNKMDIKAKNIIAFYNSLQKKNENDDYENENNYQKKINKRKAKAKKNQIKQIKIYIKN